MIYGLFALASLTASPNVVINNMAQYEVYYNATLTENFLTRNTDYGLDFVNNYANTLKLERGSYTLEISPEQNEMYWYTKIELDNDVIYYNQTYLDDFSDVSFLNINPSWYLPFDNIEDYVGKTLKLSFRVYGDADFDAFSKSPSTSFYSQYLYNTDTYEKAYLSGLSAGQAESQNKIDQAREEGKAEGIAEGISRNNNLLDMIVAIPDRFIDSFKIIFDFEILGVNIAGLMITIISLGVVIYIIKKVVS